MDEYVQHDEILIRQTRSKVKTIAITKILAKESNTSKEFNYMYKFVLNKEDNLITQITYSLK